MKWLYASMRRRLRAWLARSDPPIYGCLVQR
jgi:hypothetical protein